VNGLVVFGLGYCGERIARAVAARPGWRVVGTSRRNLPGLEVVPFEAASGALAGVTHVLSTVGPSEDAVDPVLAAHGAALAALRPRWAGYLSSTAVYGDLGGVWFNATREPVPTQPRGVARLAGERAWQAAVPGFELFRLAGIYGPGRSALDAVRGGRARRIHRPGHVFSRVHVDDVVATVLAALDRPRPGAVHDLADELPAPHDEVVAHACALLGVPPPPLEPWERAELSPALREFYAESRRVSGARTRAALGVALKHPDFRAGLSALAGADR
jgi:nucleoside-diphosphate-sugar epimerase